jgi:hypothetical protein
MLVVVAKDPSLVVGAKDTSGMVKDLYARDDLLGRVASFDGRDYTIEFSPHLAAL